MPSPETTGPTSAPHQESDQPVLRVIKLVKRYRKAVAVNDVSFEIKAGEFVGLIGPNGAGKSSTMRAIAGTINAEGGIILVDGVDVAADPVDVRRRLSFVPQDLELFEYLTGEEYLRFVAQVRGLDADSRSQQVEALLALTELSGARHRIVKEYSGGMARKLAIAGALLGPPKLLLLDESFVGLDPESTYRIRRELERFCDNGGAVLLSSHILDMVERMCSRVLMLCDGHLSFDRSQDDIASAIERGEVADLTEMYLRASSKLDALTDSEPQDHATIA